MYIFLDTARASDFATDNGQMLHLADTFVSSLQNDLQSLHLALSQSDTTDLQRLLHTLKGYVTFLCNPALANQLIDVETQARQLTVDQLKPMVENLLPSLNAMRLELNNWREELSQNT